MNIAIIHTDFRLYWPARLQALQCFLKTKKMTLHIIELAGSGSPYAFAERSHLAIENWSTLFPEKKMEDLSGANIKKQLYTLLQKINPEVIIAGAIAFPSGALSINWAKKNKRGIVIFDDAQITDVPRNKIINFIKRRIYKNVDAMFYPASTWEETGFFWNFKAEQLFYGVNTVDNYFWKQSEKTKKKYHLFIGRLIPEKNITFLLNAYQKIKDKFQDFPELWFVGDGIEKKTIDKYIKDFHIETVETLPFVTQEELRSIYKSAECLILPSIKETWGLVINEAMASGLPIIASTQCGATATLVKEGINGYQFNPFDVQSLVEKWEKFYLQNPTDKIKMGQESYRIIQEWGLDKFTSGAYQAIEYALQHKSNYKGIIDYCIINLWKGRYRPI